MQALETWCKTFLLRAEKIVSVINEREKIADETPSSFCLIESVFQASRRHPRRVLSSKTQAALLRPSRPTSVDVLALDSRGEEETN